MSLSPYVRPATVSAWLLISIFHASPVNAAVSLRPAIQLQQAQADGESPSQPLPNISVAQSHDVLEKIGQANDSLIKLAQADGRLQTNIPENYQEANNIRNLIGQAIRNYGGHSSVSGNNQYECHLMSPDLNGLIQRKEAAELRLEETKGQKRVLEIRDGPEGLRIALSNNQDYYLLFHDRRDQGVFVQESDADFLFNGHFADFNEFCLKNSDYCQTRFFPLLKRFGIQFPETAYEQNVRQLMLELIAGDDADARNLLARFGSQLLAPEFQERQGALRRLGSDFPVHRLAVIRLIVDLAQPAEMRHHLLEMVASQDQSLHATLKNIVLPQALLTNIPFLVWALKLEETAPVAATDPATGPADDATSGPAPPDPRIAGLLRQRLAQLSSLPADTPLEQWTTLALGTAPEIDPVGSLPASLFTAVDGLTMIEGKLGSVLRLVSDSQTVSWDRSRWQEAFDHQTPREHFQAVSEFLASKSLPTQWLVEPTDYKLDEDVHALVLLERLRPSIKERPANPNQNYYRTSGPQTPSNACRIDGETLLIDLDLGKSPVKLESAVCRLSLTEHGQQRRVIQFVDRPESDLSLTVRSEESAIYFRLQIKRTGETNLRQFHGNATLSQSSPSFQQFCREHPETLNEALIPLLKILGCDVQSLTALSAPQ